MALIDADASLGHPGLGPRDEPRGRQVPRRSASAWSRCSTRTTSAPPAATRAIAADRGVIGMVTSATRGVTHGADASAPSRSWAPTPRLRGARAAQRAVPARHGDDDGRRGQGEGLQAEPQAGAARAGWSTATAEPVTDEATRRSATSSSKPDGGITPLGGTARAGRATRATGSAVMVHILGGTLARRVVLAAAQPDAEAVRPAQHRPLLPGHRPARVPRRTASSRRISTR